MQFGAFAAAATPIHIAWRAETRAQVRAVHAAALLAGAMGEGAPERRPNDRPDHYAAFVLDSDGRNVEAVTCAFE